MQTDRRDDDDDDDDDQSLPMTRISTILIKPLTI